MTPDYYRNAVWDDDAVRALQERTRARQIEALQELLKAGKSLLCSPVGRSEIVRGRVAYPRPR